MKTKIVVAGVMVSGSDRSRNAAQSASTAAHQSASPAVATKPRRGSTGACWSSKAFHAASRSERSRSSVSPVGTIDPDVSGNNTMLPTTSMPAALTTAEIPIPKPARRTTRARRWEATTMVTRSARQRRSMKKRARPMVTTSERAATAISVATSVIRRGLTVSPRSKPIDRAASDLQVAPGRSGESTRRC